MTLLAGSLADAYIQVKYHPLQRFCTACLTFEPVKKRRPQARAHTAERSVESLRFEQAAY